MTSPAPHEALVAELKSLRERVMGVNEKPEALLGAPRARNPVPLLTGGRQ